MFVWICLIILVEVLTFGFTNKKLKAAGKRGIRILANIGFILILLVTLRCALFPPVGEMPTNGQYEITSNEYWLEEDRVDPYLESGDKRVLWVREWKPVDCDEEKPVVIASHGSCGSIDNNRSMYRELASNGYTVLAVAHYGQSASFVFEDGKSTGPSMIFIKQMTSLDPENNPEEAFEVYKEWMDIRTTDLNTVMDDYNNKNGKTEFVAMGHSLGGSAAYAMARIRSDVIGVVALESPFMYDIEGVENGKYVFNQEDYNVPLLNIYSDSVYPHLFEADFSEYANNKLFLERSNEQYTTIHYEGVGHMGLCDLSRQSPILAAMFSGGFQKVNARIQLDTLNKDCLEWIENIR
ncbi:alpha/beta hydrolase [Pseudobutyrivibrio xylanivorans]|uniref:Alpha/beta hydrolase family protein n=1 Tax=Pseudobutyrivibrio xylanivorans DSM 14809 TaxID=1123012 RepID=A0A1M6AP27_PSEXY|nr:alpha/beta fold hydrolase [Pseudobutyrivibrio xylanivorans]SHI38222.1 Alpha/beta hydrolase family protein [Pseudobutyrivibrio xylanivorans DSM 14809]